MSTTGVAFRVLDDIKKIMNAEEARMKKAMKNALQVAGYRHMKAFRDETTKGGLGLKPLTPYRNNPRLRASKNLTPLKALRSGIMYGRDRSGNALRVGVGFLAFDPVFARRTTNLQKWGKVMAEKHLPGYRYAYSGYQRKLLIRGGVYLKKDTTGADVPARDLVGAYYDRHQAEFGRDVADLFGRKFAGEHI